MSEVRMAIMYDFDKTLSPRNMQEFGMEKRLGFDNPDDFWDVCGQTTKEYNMDHVISYMLEIIKRYPNLTDEALREEGKNIEFYDGVESWFKRINDYGLERGIIVEHYIISSGLTAMIEGTRIADEFKRIYGCEFAYTDNGIFPSRVVNYTTKTQYAFRINKGVLDADNDSELNGSTADDEKYIPFNRMIYIGDGLTDVPCMKVVSMFGGRTIAVYGTEESRQKLAKPLYKGKRATFMAKADYTEGSEIDKIIKNVIDLISASVSLEDFRLDEEDE